jgi:hypothetical protein
VGNEKGEGEGVEKEKGEGREVRGEKEKHRTGFGIAASGAKRYWRASYLVSRGLGL